MPTAAEVKRGRDLEAMSDEEFLKLWPKYRHMTPNELNEVEPFFLVVAISKLRKHVES